MFYDRWLLIVVVGSGVVLLLSRAVVRHLTVQPSDFLNIHRSHANLQLACWDQGYGADPHPRPHPVPQRMKGRELQASGGAIFFVVFGDSFRSSPQALWTCLSN